MWCPAGTTAADPPQLLRDLVAWTRAPACVVSVYGSDYALARGLAPTGCWWEAWLNPEAAATMLTEVPDDVDDLRVWSRSPQFAAAVLDKRAALDAGVPIDARGALAWARSAGFGQGVDPAAVEAVLRSREAFAERLVPALLDALGFPAPVPAREEASLRGHAVISG